MGNCLPCLHEEERDRRSARSSYFDAKRREKELMDYTRSEFKKENDMLRVSNNYKKKKPSPNQNMHIRRWSPLIGAAE